MTARDFGTEGSAAQATGAGPLTLGTAGHVDHGKTALVAALTGVDTDRLPEEKARGLTIVLGYAPLVLPGGRRLSLIDVPGHERFVRTMVAGASGVDVFLMVVAADDGVMPQTVEHTQVLRALGVSRGVVAISKCDLADPAPAAAQISELLPNAPIVCCCATGGEGVEELRGTLERVTRVVPSRSHLPGPPRLHVDRVFSVAGRGTVVTGTLWSGSIARGEELALLPAQRNVRVRGVQVHDSECALALAGQRVAVNLSGVKAREIARGDALATAGSVRETAVLDCLLALERVRHGDRVQVHHGTRAVPARLAWLAGCEGGDLWQVRLERPLLALAGDRIVVRAIAPSSTLGGGVVLDAHAARHGRRQEILSRLEEVSRRAARGDASLVAEAGATVQAPAPRCAQRAGDDTAREAVPEQALIGLEARLREAGTALLSEAQLAAGTAALRELRARGRAVRVSGRLYAHAEVADEVRRQVIELIKRDGSVTLPGLRDELEISRKSAQAFLEHLDAVRVTRRLADNRRVLRHPRRVTIGSRT